MTAPASRLVRIAIEPRREHDRPALLEVLEAMAEDEPGRLFTVDARTGPVLLEAEAEGRLETAVAILRRRCVLDLTIGALQVIGRESVTRRVEVDWTHRPRAVEGRSAYARVKIVLAPGATSSIETWLPGGSIPPALVAGVERGIARAFDAGAMAGFPLIDVTARLIDGAWHEIDSSPLAFEAAACAAVAHAQREVGVLLEPIRQVEVVTSARYAGAVHRDLAARRGNIGSPMSSHGGSCVISAAAPLADLLGYERRLRLLTEGGGRLMMTFSHFAPIDLPGPPPIGHTAALRLA